MYDGLLIDNNTITVLNAQSSNPENILGIWENGHARIERYARPAPVHADHVRDGDQAELVEECRAVFQ